MFTFSTESALEFWVTRHDAKLCAMILAFILLASYLLVTVCSWMILLTTFSTLYISLLLILGSGCCSWLLWSQRHCHISHACYTCHLWKGHLYRWDLGWHLTNSWRDHCVHPNLCSGCKTNWCNRLCLCLYCAGTRLIHTQIYQLDWHWFPNNRSHCNQWLL